MKINENQLAKWITEREGLKQPVNIAQVKEVLRVIGELLAELPASAVMEWVERHE